MRATLTLTPITPISRTSYAGIEGLLYRQDGQWLAGRPVARNTYLERRGTQRSIALKLHGQDLILWHPDNTVTLDSCGWTSHTSRSRMNEWLPLDSGNGRFARVEIDNGYWVVNFTSHGNNDLIDVVNFHDGMIIDMATLTEFTPKYDRTEHEIWNQGIDRLIEAWENDWPNKVKSGMGLWDVPQQGIFNPRTYQDMRDQLYGILCEHSYPSALMNALNRYRIVQDPYRLVKKGASIPEQRPLKDALRKLFRGYLYEGWHVRRTIRFFDRDGNSTIDQYGRVRK